VNRAEKEQYLRDYATLKSQGKPFFPYAVAKDSIMACVVLAAIITLSIVLGAELGPKADPTTTTYVPRPEWYFFFLFELLRVIKPPELTTLATIGIPTICMIMLFLLPFIDRGPERRPERRPIATISGILVIFAMGYLTYLGAVAGSPNSIDMQVPASLEHGKQVVAQSGCLACHKIGHNGGDLGPHLTDIGDKLEPAAIRRTLDNPTAPMPSFANLPEEKKAAMVDFLASLKGDTQEGGVQSTQDDEAG
jgi:mono/diheme cytochrome c family protein